MWLVLGIFFHFEIKKLIIENDHTHFFKLVKEVCLCEYFIFGGRKKKRSEKMESGRMVVDLFVWLVLVNDHELKAQKPTPYSPNIREKV